MAIQANSLQICCLKREALADEWMGSVSPLKFMLLKVNTSLITRRSEVNRLFELY